MAKKVNKKLRERLKKLFAMLGSSNANEAEAARRKIVDLLARHKKTWNDLPEPLQTTQAEDVDHPAAPDDLGTPPPPLDGATQNLFDLLRDTLDRYVAFKLPHETVAVALWTMHTFVFSQFMVTPRLALLSPVRGCGKSTVLDVLDQLTLRPLKYEHTTAAGIYHAIDNEKPTLLLDEVDNLELGTQGIIRAVLNSGHRKRTVDRTFSTFAPAAFSAPSGRCRHR